MKFFTPKRLSYIIFALLVVSLIGIILVRGKAPIFSSMANDSDTHTSSFFGRDSKDEEPEETTGPTYELVKAPKGYFDDALLIGDSRAEGIRAYKDQVGMGGADFFTATGMGVVNSALYTWQYVDGYGNTCLENLLTTNKYGKVYIALGLNDLYWDMDTIEDSFCELLNRIKETQPDAIIYIISTLHVTENKSTSHPYFNNPNVNKYNTMTQKYVDEKKVFYLDSNVLFDDANGNLDTQYAGDGAHLMGQGYIDWAEWICDNTVKFN